MEIKLFTSQNNTSGGGVGFKFVGNVDVAKPKPKYLLIKGTTTNPNETVKFTIDEDYEVASDENAVFELYGDSNRLENDLSVRSTTLKTIDELNLSMNPFIRFGSVFGNCTELTSLNISALYMPTSNSINYFFYGCSKLSYIDMSGFQFDGTAETYGMFEGCTSLSKIKVKDQMTANAVIAQIKKDLGFSAVFDGVNLVRVSNPNIKAVNNADNLSNLSGTII